MMYGEWEHNDNNFGIQGTETEMVKHNVCEGPKLVPILTSFNIDIKLNYPYKLDGRLKSCHKVL